MANPNAKPPAPLVGHKPDCPCPVCRQPKEPAKAWKLPAELTNYIREHGGGPWLAALVRREMSCERRLR